MKWNNCELRLSDQLIMSDPRSRDLATAVYERSNRRLPKLSLGNIAIIWREVSDQKSQIFESSSV